MAAGGVAANGVIRTTLERVAARNGFRFAAPPLRLCTDNAMMVAWTGIERLRLGLADGSDAAPRPRWPLEAIGEGRPAAATREGALSRAGGDERQRFS